MAEEMSPYIENLAKKVWPEGTIGENLRRQFLIKRIEEAILLSKYICIL